MNRTSVNKRLYLLCFLCVIMLITIWFSIKIITLKNTHEIPLSNLRDFRNSSCYIYFTIDYQGENSIVVFENSKMFFRMSMENKLIPFIYPLWLSGKMENNKSIKVDERLYEEFKWFIVKNDLVQKFIAHDILKDTSIVKNGYLEGLSQDEENAIIYVLLKKGINCCPNCESGFIKVIPPDARSLQ